MASPAVQRTWSVPMPASTFRGLIAFGLAAATVGALAQTPFEQRVDRRQERQQQRIANGIASGQLTAPEAARLERQQAGVARMESRFEADGALSRREALRLEHRQDRTSRHIAWQKHDRQVRR
jgi:hypothetical protein